MIVSTKKELINTYTVLKLTKITLLHNYCCENHIKPENLPRPNEVLRLNIGEFNRN